MEISDDYAWKSREGKRANSPLLPSNIRGLIVGKSSCGKTTLLLNLLLQPNWLDYSCLKVFGKSLHQQEYKILQKAYANSLSKSQISNVFKNQNKIQGNPLELIDEFIKHGGVANGHIKADFYSDCSNVPDPGELDDSEKNLLILDDCLLEKQSKAESYYTRGRHSNCDVFYISQSYFRLPRQTIRENTNFIILFPQDMKNLNHIHADHCTDMDVQEFKEFCEGIWSKQYDFVTIDLSSSKYNGKYRKNLDEFYFPYK